MKRALKVIGASAWLAWTLILNIYHAGVYPPPKVDFREVAKAAWFDRREFGINHMVLSGSPFARGRRAGELTRALLQEQEETLITQLRTWVPSRLALQGIILGAITWFQGVDRYLDPHHTAEMYGTSLSAPKAYDYLADGFTRQVAYHGLHEVGQMMVDQGFEDMGCTVVAVPLGKSFVLGRNFDFEGGRIFDSEKIVKWVFPEHGHAFASVIWAGMVGAVTGVNDKGLYVSINAGGSADLRRLGNPSTLVLLKILEEADDASAALKILADAQMFITDIFVILDGQGHLYRVEKSPARMAVIPLHGPAVVTNHLIAEEFAGDKTNAFRMRELTSVVRQTRGEALVNALPPAQDPQGAAAQVLGVLRDKGVDEQGQPLTLGNRRAIDALIATHSVIYAPTAHLFYVGEGPAVAGRFHGYDLNQSFAARRPVEVAALPADPQVTPETFNALKDANQKIARAQHLIQFKRCTAGLALLNEIGEQARAQSIYYQALGDGQSCLGAIDQAQSAWDQALALHPAYARFTRALESRRKGNP